MSYAVTTIGFHHTAIGHFSCVLRVLPMLEYACCITEQMHILNIQCAVHMHMCVLLSTCSMHPPLILVHEFSVSLMWEVVVPA